MVFAALAGMFALAACSEPRTEVATADAADAAVADTPADPLTVTVVGHDFSFEAPESVPAGPSTFRLVNRGAELHHIQIFRLNDGRTLAELGEALASGALPEWAVPVGGPVAAAPGAEIATEVDLEAGNYALTCVIPSPDGVPHMAKGMARELTVTDNPAPPAPAVATMDLELRDYGFVFNGDITAGTHTFRVFNSAGQWHEILFVKLAEGATAQDVIVWSHKPEGPPPGMPIGGVAGLANGEENRLTLTFEKGRYALLCFLPDATTGQAHHVHGMVREIEVL